MLETLFEGTDEHGGMCYSFSYIAHKGLDTKAVRKACRSLKKKGLAEFHRGLMTEENEVAGSGYCISSEGVKLIDKQWEDEK